VSTPPSWRGFASDNYASIHPDVLEAIARANAGHDVSYGDDAVTAQLSDAVKDVFGSRAEVFPVFNGTGANVVALQAMTRRWEAVVCAESAHIHADEGGAPEKMAGLKLWTITTPDGKLTPDLLDTQAWGFGTVHRAQPGAVSITQSTELGTVYTVDEIGALAAHARSLGLRTHIDAVSFGGTKNGLMIGEAVIVLNAESAPGVDFLRKTSMQLASKMRFVSAQLLALLTDDLWLRNASHANAMAALLASRVRGLPGLSITQPVQANAVFAVLPAQVTARLQQRFRHYTWDAATGEVRWMCSWDTTIEDVDAFAAAVATELERG